jgi:hypothetical protein
MTMVISRRICWGTQRTWASWRRVCNCHSNQARKLLVLHPAASDTSQRCTNSFPTLAMGCSQSCSRWKKEQSEWVIALQKCARWCDPTTTGSHPKKQPAAVRLSTLMTLCVSPWKVRWPKLFKRWQLRLCLNTDRYYVLRAVTNIKGR